MWIKNIQSFTAWHIMPTKGPANLLTPNSDKSKNLHALLKHYPHNNV